MSKRIRITSILLFFVLLVGAQEKLNFATANQQSYKLFLEKNWKQLIKFSSEARAQNIDFFYLQVRTGIAFYNLKKYRQAAFWFLKAWQNDKSFDWLQEYLYYSLKFSGRTNEAEKAASYFTKNVKQKIAFKNSKALSIAVEGGYSFNPGFDGLISENHAETAGVGQNYGEAFYLKNYSFQAIDFSHQIAPGFIVNHNFTKIGVNREEQVYWGANNSFPIKINQYQYFVNPVFLLKNKIYVSPSMSLVWGNSNIALGDVDPNTFYTSDINYFDYIFSVSGWTNFRNFSPGIEINQGNIYDTNLTQFSGWITYYPFSNNSFYITPRVYFKHSSTTKTLFNTFGISGGKQIGPVHLYVQYLNGDMENFIESAGYIIANFPGKSTRKISGSVYIPFAENYRLVLRYINQDIQENYQVYVNGQPENSINYKYIKHTLTAGISWIF